MFEISKESWSALVFVDMPITKQANFLLSNSVFTFTSHEKFLVLFSYASCKHVKILPFISKLSAQRPKISSNVISKRARR